MKHYRQFEPIVISDFEASVWQHPEHDHNHYEIIFIKAGYGKHVINGIEFSYVPGNVFLLGPEEAHYFEIKSSTHFIYLKFTDAYLYQDDGGTFGSGRNLNYLIKSRETHLAGFTFAGPELQTVGLLFEVLRTLKNDVLGNQKLIWMQLLTLSHILKRNMPELAVLGDRIDDMQALYCYIHKNIYEPCQLKSKVIAERFNLAQGYLGLYFKRNTGTTLKSYIQEYRATLIKQRISTGNYSLKQIAGEFGLTDASHVSKIIQRKE